MSLIDGLILHTLDRVNHVSQHAMLMRFYELDKEIAYHLKTHTYKECFHDVSLYFKEIEARSILKSLNIT